MDFLDLIVGGIGSIFSGGLTGILGAVITKFAEYQQRQQDIKVLQISNEHELKLRDADAKIMEQEWNGRERLALVEGETQQQVASDEAFAQSYHMEPKRYSDFKESPWLIRFMLGLLDVVRGGVRPGLTIYLAALTTTIYWQFQAMIETFAIQPSSDQAMATLNLMISTFLYLFTTAFLWWFGTRNKQKPPKIV